MIKHKCLQFLSALGHFLCVMFAIFMAAGAIASFVMLENHMNPLKWGVEPRGLLTGLAVCLAFPSFMIEWHGYSLRNHLDD